MNDAGSSSRHLDGTHPAGNKQYEELIKRIRRTVDDVNRELGIDITVSNWDVAKVTFGYIGNSGHGYDDRAWSVFLPHTGRAGTEDDRIGSFRTGDVNGALTTLTALMGFRRGLTWRRGA